MADVTVDELSIRISANANAAAESIATLTSALSRMNVVLGRSMSGLRGLSPTLARIKSVNRQISAAAVAASPTVATKTISPVAIDNTAVKKIKALDPPIKKVTESLKKMGTTGKKSTSLLGGSFIQLRSKIFFAYFALDILAATIGRLISEAMKYSEQMHLFGTVFGELGAAANDYADAISSVLGIDPVAFKETYSTFYLMASTLGIGADAANKMSQNLTQLSYDYASLLDIPFEDAQAKFQSMLSGQTRAVYAFGIDVTKASLQEELYREGINASIESLTKAQKAILAVNLAVRQSTTAQGDLARTITQPANMLRILKDQFSIAARVIGYLFMPAIQAILPWLILLTQALTRAAQALLALFGISMPGWESFASNVAAGTGGTDDLYDSVSDVGDATSGAANAMRELRDYTMGIDELNILPDQSASGGGGGGGGGGSGIDIPVFDVYDMIGGFEGLSAITDPLVAKLQAFLATIQPLVDALKRLWDALKPFAANVWEGFKSFWIDVFVPALTNKMNTDLVDFIDSLTDALNWFNENPEVAKNIGMAFGVFALILPFIKPVVAIFKFIIGSAVKLVAVVKTIGTVIDVIRAMWAAFSFFAFAAEGGSVIGGLSAAFTALSTAIGSVGWAFLAIVAIIAIVVAAVLFLIKNWKKIVDTAKELRTKLSEIWGYIGDTVTTVWNNILTVIENVWKGIKAAVLIPLALIGTLLEAAWNGIKETALRVWNSLPAPIREKLTEIWNTAKTIGTWIGDFFKNLWEHLGDALPGVIRVINSMFQGMVNFLIDQINRIISIINQIISFVKRIDTTGISDSIEYLVRLSHVGSARQGQSTIGGVLMASGGMPFEGQMFIAGEAGPELVGSFGGNSNTVMPLENSGFVEAMASAVYSATVAAMGSRDRSDGSGDVYIDGVKAGQIIANSMRKAGLVTT